MTAQAKTKGIRNGAKKVSGSQSQNNLAEDSSPKKYRLRKLTSRKE